jgi:hypothetical protein
VIVEPGHAHVRDAVPGGDGRDQRLGAIAARHADHIGAPRDSVLRQLQQVIPGLQDDRLDAPLPAFLRQPESLGLPASRFQFMIRTGCSAAEAGLRWPAVPSAVARSAIAGRLVSICGI